MAIKTKVFILILNYRHYKDTLKCIGALKRSDLPSNTKILVLDNSENDISVEKIGKKYPRITIIQHSHNLGFAGGNNPGIDHALKKGATHVLIINPDVTVPHRFLKPLLSSLKQNNLDIIAPAIKHKQKDQWFYGLEGLVNFTNGKATHLNLKKIPSKDIRPAKFVTFACVLISSSVFKKIGLLNEKYFMYLEDVDFCLRASCLGFKIGLDPQVIVKHKTSSSFSRPTKKLKISFHSQLIFISSWLKFPQKIYAYLYTIVHYVYLYFLWTYHFYKYSR